MYPFSAGEVEGSVPARFARVSADRAGALAIVTERERLSYGQLDRRSDALAAALARAGDLTDAPVAVLASEPAATVAAMLGVWKAGRFCVPLDDALPTARLEVILRDAEAGLLVTDAAAAARLPVAFDGRVLRMDEIDLGGFAGPPAPAPTGDTLACLLYTSGSTGAPKGVVRTHRNLLHRARCAVASLAIGPDDRVSALHSPAFGAGLRDVLAALLGGATLFPFDLRRASLAALADWIDREHLTVLCGVVTTLRRLLASLPPDRGFPSVRIVRLGSEPLFRADVERLRKRLAPGCVIVAGYGASEASGIVEHRIDPDTPLPPGRVPAGYPLDGVEILILGETGAALGAGEVGEIAVRSRYLSPGYWRRPDQTRALFADSSDSGIRIYRTGDLGRLAPDGCLEVIGRLDHQVKVRGYLVHPDEIERRLAEHPGIREAVVVGRDDATGETRLVAYVVPAASPGPSLPALRKFLQSRLPEYMLPAAYVSLGSLPVTVNGKVDRAALPPPAEGPRPTARVGLRNPLEDQIAAIWEELFHVRPVGATDDFFELGGDSLLAAAFVAALERAHGRVVSPSLLLEASTVGELAAALRRAQPAGRAPIVALRAFGWRAPLFFLHGDYNGGGLYCHALARRLDAERPFYVMDPHGIDGQPLPATIEEMAVDRLAALRAARPHGPYLLGGYCNGALVALEIARRLRAAGERVGTTVLIDARAPLRGHHLLQRGLDALERSPRLPDALRAQLSAGLERGADWTAYWTRYYQGRVRGLAGSPLRSQVAQVGRSLAVAARDLAHVLTRRQRRGASAAGDALATAPPDTLPRQRHRLYHAAFGRYAPAPYEGRVALLRAEEEPAYRPDLGWSRVLPHLEVAVVPGSHLTCITRHVDAFAARLEQILRQGEDTP